MTDTAPAPVWFRLIGPDTGIARLLADLELAGSDYPIIAEPDTDDDGNPLDPASYSGSLTGLTADQVATVGRAYLATTTNQRLWLDDTELDI